jgi:HAD superfamily phosphatase (TIGR01668 family)
VTYVSEVSLDKLAESGKSAIILDLDNTIVPRDTGVPSQEVVAWILEAKAKNFKICFLSNNWHKEVFEWAKLFEIPMIYKAMKPFPLAFRLTLKKMKAKAKETVVIGDQLLTDILGAKLSGISAILVSPLSEKDLPHTLLLRKVERMILGKRNAN